MGRVLLPAVALLLSTVGCASRAPTVSNAPPPRSAASTPAAPEAAQACEEAPAERAAATTVFVVRHAEKAGESGDVPLSDEGEARAEDLARLLRDVPLHAIHSTETVRTRTTAAAAARDANLPVEIYDHNEPQALVGSLLDVGGTHLVIGHSNTVPELVELLGGDPGPVLEPTDYDRVYVVVVPTQGPPNSWLLHYGN